MKCPLAARCFNEFIVRVPGDTGHLLEEMRREKIIGGLHLEKLYPELKNHLLMCFTETVSKAAIDRVVEACRQFATHPRLAAPISKADPKPASRKSVRKHHGPN